MKASNTPNKIQNIALIGNPNVGKSSIFNALTGLNQKVGNFPGVTVDKKTGILTFNKNKVTITDLPGLYSLFAKSPDERVVVEALLGENKTTYEIVLVVLDAVNLERSLMLYTQVLDLGFDAIPILTMNDIAIKQGINIDIQLLKNRLDKQLFVINARNDSGLTELVDFLNEYKSTNTKVKKDFIDKLLCTQAEFLTFADSSQKNYYNELLKNSDKDVTDIQLEDTFSRMDQVYNILKDDVLTFNKIKKSSFSRKVDKIITHPILGYLIYFAVLLTMFQLIFSFAEYPMNWIDSGFSALNGFLSYNLPDSIISNLLTEGLLAGIGGVVIFIPQIALLFGFISILEESGYMSRVVYLMDRPMRIFGLNGKSVVPLISGAACAVPAIMSARGIDAMKERLVTVFVTPFISCAARLPVYIIIIALVIPDGYILGISYKGLTLMGLYLAGIGGALLTALLMNRLLKKIPNQVFVIDIPGYKIPRWKNVLLTILQKTKTFVLEAGKIILAISVILWAMASYGPPESMKKAETDARLAVESDRSLVYEQILSAKKLEASFIGHIGHIIEPVIKPLGYDWKIGIALITSFAAREVFVGTLGTIYSVGDENLEEGLVKRLEKEKSANGEPVFNFATGMSLLIFYVFALQCMSTIAVVYRETGGWKWPIIQLFYMTFLAYVLALLTYSILS